MACNSVPACEQYAEEVQISEDAEGSWRLGTDMKHTALRQMVATACTDVQFDAVLAAVAQDCSFPSISCCLSSNGSNLDECNATCVDRYTNAESCLRAAVLEQCSAATDADADAFAGCHTAMGTTPYPLEPVFCGEEATLFGLPVMVAVALLIGGAIVLIAVVVWAFSRSKDGPSVGAVLDVMYGPEGSYGDTQGYYAPTPGYALVDTGYENGV